jgi:integrase
MSRKTKKQTRRGNKEGSIYQRKDGQWCGQILVGYNELGKPIRKTLYAATREDIARKVIGTANQVFNGTFAAPAPSSVITVEKLVSDFLWTFKRPTISDVTFEWYLGIAKTHIIPALGSINIRELTPYAIQSLLNTLHGQKKLSQRLIKGVRETLNQAYNHAIELKLADTNPALGTKLPKQSRSRSNEKEDAKVIPLADRAKILTAAEDDLRMKTAITTLLFTGMRVGEFLAMTWGQVNFKDSTITIDRGITHSCEYHEDGRLKRRRTVVGDTKTQCSVRTIKASPVVLDTLRAWRKALPGHMRSTPGHDILAKDAVVFPNDMGKMRTYDGFRTTYRRFMSENGLGNYPIHSYRHTFTTMLLERGVNPKVVQKLLGHRDIETTLGIYSHVLPEVFDCVSGMIDGIHADILDGSYRPVIMPLPLVALS